MSRIVDVQETQRAALHEFELEDNLKLFVGLHSFFNGKEPPPFKHLGGLRWRPRESYADGEISARKEAENLAFYMTRKAAIHTLPLHGGKAVVFGHVRKQGKRRASVLRRIAECIDTLPYITAEDSGTSVADMREIGKTTKHVCGLPREDGGSGDPSPKTALGVFLAMQAALCWIRGRDNNSLAGLTVGVEGAGNVGSQLIRLLLKAGATVTFSEKVLATAQKVLGECENRSEQLRLTWHDSDWPVYANKDIDIYAPCGVEPMPRGHEDALAAKIMCGAANIQFIDVDNQVERLTQKNVLVVPEYVANVGGLINVASEFDSGGYREKTALGRIATIPDTCQEVFRLALLGNQTTYAAAEILARARAAELA